MENLIVSELGRLFESKLGFGEKNKGVDVSSLPVDFFMNRNGALSHAIAIETSLSHEWAQLHLQQAEEEPHSAPWSLENPFREISEFTRYKEEFIRAVHGQQVLIVCGGIGSDQTMQFIEYLSEAGYNDRGMIGCTQLLYCKASTLIDALLQEIALDENLKRFSAIILDVTCERTVYTDLLLGLLKKLVQRRPDFRLIITCDFREVEKFSQYFFNCAIFVIPSLMRFPLEIHYTKSTETDYLKTAVVTVLQLHLTEPEGDILVFFNDQEDIVHAHQSLTEKMAGLGSEMANRIEFIVVPDSDVQSNFFYAASFGKRKVFLATDMVVSSLRIHGIIYVVDSGFSKVNLYNPKHGLNSQVIVPISQTLADDRARCASHMRPGKCFRLYTESVYHDEMLPESVPDIQRINFASVVLKMKAIGVSTDNILAFDFIDPPSNHSICDPMRELYLLGALDEEGRLKEMGRTMSGFSIEPSLSKMLSSSLRLGCTEEIINIIAMLRLGNIFYRPFGKEPMADERRARFIHPEGDHLTLLAVYNVETNSLYLGGT